MKLSRFGYSVYMDMSDMRPYVSIYGRHIALLMRPMICQNVHNALDDCTKLGYLQAGAADL